MPKHAELHINRKHQKFNGTRERKYPVRLSRPGDFTDHKPAYFNEEVYHVQCDYRESKEFKTYREFVEATLKALARPVTMRELNTALGDRKIAKWTADCLDTSVHVLWFKGYIDRWAWFKGLAKPEPWVWNQTNAALFDGQRSVAPNLALEGR